MYNIDFKLSTGQIVSIPVNHTDTVRTLMTRMQQQRAFRKYNAEELKQKLMKCLKQIIKSQSIQLRIRSRIKELIDKAQDEKHNQTIELKEEQVFKKIHCTNTKNNKTFVNLLQQSTINNSYLFQGINNPSQVKLKRNYLNSSEEPYQSVIEDKLIYNYQPKDKENKYETIFNNGNRVNVQDYLKQRNHQKHRGNTKQFSYLNEDQKKYEREKRISEIQQKYQTRKDDSDAFQVLKNRQFDKKRNSMSSDKLFRRNYPQTSNPSSIQAQNAQNQRDFICQRKPAYNPVPKLNQLIQKSRSLSQIVQREHCPQLRVKLSSNSGISQQKRPSVGRIRHYQDKSQYQKPSTNVNLSLNNLSVNYENHSRQNLLHNKKETIYNYL